jgi:hypothetical protein
MSTTNLLGILISDYLDELAASSDAADNLSAEHRVDGLRAQLDQGDDLEGLAAELALPTTGVDVIREIVATTRTRHGGTRVIEVTAEITKAGIERITIAAYDSAHPDAVHLLSHDEYSEANLADARTKGSKYFDPSAEDCDCWYGWDPYCGAKGCWGIYVRPAHTPMVLAGAR